MTSVDQLFKVEYPKTMVLSAQKRSKNGVNFVSSTGSNNGVSAAIEDTNDYKKYPSGAITVALKGTVMSAHLQPRSFYIAHQTAVLSPKVKMTEAQLLYYCLCLRANKYRFNYGRQADRTLRNLHIPDIDEIPDWVSTSSVANASNLSRPAIVAPLPHVDASRWNFYKLSDLFEIKKGKRLTKQNMKLGSTPFIGSSDSNNGLTATVGQAPIHEGNTISVCYNGSVAEAFYQPVPFWASDDVNVLYPKFKMNKEIALFVSTVITHEKYRYNYGRKWHLGRMLESKIKLPANQDGSPDWQYMENFIKSLPYSASI